MKPNSNSIEETSFAALIGLDWRTSFRPYLHAKSLLLHFLPELIGYVSNHFRRIQRAHLVFHRARFHPPEIQEVLH